MRRLLPLLLVLACGAPVDPLAETRQSWQALAMDDASDWPAHAVLVLDHTEVAVLGLEALAVPETIALSGPMGMPLVVRPTIDTVDTRPELTEGPGLRLTGSAVGSVDVQIPPFVRVTDLPVTVTLSVQLDLMIRDGQLVLTAVDPEGISAETRFGTLPPQIAALADGLLDGWLVDQAKTALAAGLPLGPAPNLGPVAILDARLLPGEDLTIALRLPSAVPGEAAAPPELDGGWAFAADLDAILRASRVLALEQPPDSKYVFEPSSLDIDGSNLVVDLRWHRRSTAPKWRDLRLTATLVDDGQSLSPRLDAVENIGNERWGGAGPMGIVLRQAQQQLAQSGVELSHTIPLAGLKRTASWSNWTVEGDDLVVRGSLLPQEDSP